MNDSKIRNNKYLTLFDWKTLAAVLLMCLLVVFAMNLLKTNKPADYSDSEIKENIALVESVQQASVDDVEAAVDQLEAVATGGPSSSSVKAYYMRKFRDCVVVGDSLTEGLSVYGWLPSSQVFSEIGASVIYGDSMFESAAKAKPKYAFFAFGMNDMGNYSGDAKKFTKRYGELIDRFHKLSPDTKIFVCSISTPTADAIKDNSSIGHYKEFNKAIKQMCKDKKIKYIDISQILVEHPDLYAGDGIHADTSYYPLWMDMMAKKAGLK
jgi:hypothetical protein